MRAVPASCRVLLLLMFAPAVGGCSAPPPGPVADAVARDAVPKPTVERGAAPAPRPTSAWPDDGWLRLDTEVFVTVGDGAEVDAAASLAAVWTPGRLEIWVRPLEPAGPGDVQPLRRTETGAAADRTLGALRQRFDVGVATGLDPRGPGGFGGDLFVATDREVDTVVSERWEIGDGPAPWGSDGPFADGS